jgi:hypothetical protein
MSYAQIPSGPPPKPMEASMPSLAGPERMEYMRAYNFIFENPNWAMNVLWGFLCIISTVFIPVVGQLLFLGYVYETIEGLYLTRGTRYPDFDLNKFGDYIMRGLWPTVVQLVVGMLLAVVIVPLVFVGLFAVAFAADAAGNDLGGVVAAIGFFLWFLLVIGAVAVMNLFVMPLALRAGLSQDIGEGFKFGWAKDFVSKVWLESILAALFLMVTSLIAMALGALALCIGMYAAMAVVFLASGHLNYQLYCLYLARGGEPIPLKSKAPPAVMPPMPQY